MKRTETDEFQLSRGSRLAVYAAVAFPFVIYLAVALASKPERWRIPKLIIPAKGYPGSGFPFNKPLGISPNTTVNYLPTGMALAVRLSKQVKELSTALDALTGDEILKQLKKLEKQTRDLTKKVEQILGSDAYQLLTQLTAAGVGRAAEDARENAKAIVGLDKKVDLAMERSKQITPLKESIESATSGLIWTLLAVVGALVSAITWAITRVAKAISTGVMTPTQLATLIAREKSGDDEKS